MSTKKSRAALAQQNVAQCCAHLRPGAMAASARAGVEAGLRPAPKGQSRVPTWFYAFRNGAKSNTVTNGSHHPPAGLTATCRSLIFKGVARFCEPDRNQG